MLKLKEKIYERLITDVKKASPNEACGIIGGKKESGEETVEEIYPCENESDTPDSEYLIAPADALEVFEKIEENGQDILGSYHSHPGSLQPSDQDKEEAYWEDHIYLIASKEKEEIEAWCWSGQGFEKEELEII